MAADGNARLLIVLEAQSRKLQNELVRTNRLIDRFAAQTERRFAQMSTRNAKSFDDLGRRMRGTLGGLQNILGPLIGTLGAREVIRYSDAWTEAGNKIAAASQVAGIQARSLGELKDAANGARAPLEQYVDLYSRILRVSPGIAATELEVAAATDIVAKSLKAGGASAQEQAAALIQLGQALGSGFLQGDELRSIRENAPLLAQAIAKEFGVTISQLKKLGAEGELTSARVFKAIIGGGAEIEAAFAATQSTIGQAFTRIENEFTQYIGTAGRASGATQGLVDALRFVADNFTEIADVVVQFAAVLAGAFAGKAIVGGIGAATIALGAFLTALRAGTLTAITFSAALGPIGLLAGAAAAALAILWYESGRAARVAEEHSAALATNAEAMDTSRDASRKFREALTKNIALQVKAAQVALAEARAQLEAAKARASLATGLSELFGGAAGSGGLNDALNIDPRASANQGMVSPAEDALAVAEQSLRDLVAQLNTSLTILDTPEGTGDRARGPKGTGDGSGKAKGDSQFQNALDGINKRTAALVAQTAAQAKVNPLVDDYGFAMEKAKAASDLLSAAQDANMAITPELKAQIDALATGYANASVEAKKLGEEQDKVRESAEYMRDSLKDVTRSWIQDLLDGKSAAEAFGNALGNIGDRLINLGLDSLFGGGQTKGFGAIGKLFGFAKGGVAQGGRPKMFAKGGVSNTAAIFGEGPMAEAAVPLPDGRRIPVDLRMPQGSGGGSITAPVSIHIDATGADAAGLARVENRLAKLQAELPATVISTVKAAKSRRIL